MSLSGCLDSLRESNCSSTNFHTLRCVEIEYEGGVGDVVESFPKPDTGMELSKAWHIVGVEAS